MAVVAASFEVAAAATAVFQSAATASLVRFAGTSRRIHVPDARRSLPRFSISLLPFPFFPRDDTFDPVSLASRPSVHHRRVIACRFENPARSASISLPPAFLRSISFSFCSSSGPGDIARSARSRDNDDTSRRDLARRLVSIVYSNHELYVMSSNHESCTSRRLRARVTPGRSAPDAPTARPGRS